MAFGSRDGPVNLRLTGLRTTGSLASTTDGVTSPSDPIPDRMLALTGDVVFAPSPGFLFNPTLLADWGRADCRPSSLRTSRRARAGA